MSTFRTNKKLIRTWFENNIINDTNYLPPELMEVPEMEVINALSPACRRKRILRTKQPWQ